MTLAIEQTVQFRRDLKREGKGRAAAVVRARLTEVIEDLAAERPLASARRDHALTGRWAGFRDCHIRPDLVLIYRVTEDRNLHLVRLGSHSELEIG